mmetsp:Transcript_27395/g.93505  ORF Transcript_27395/g.93505 Transcript_27395/m.93505 type:complete len:247 (+) Transcript_27395:475-1215(+)
MPTTPANAGPQCTPVRICSVPFSSSPACLYFTCRVTSRSSSHSFIALDVLMRFIASLRPFCAVASALMPVTITYESPRLSTRSRFWYRCMTRSNCAYSSLSTRTTSAAGRLAEILVKPTMSTNMNVRSSYESDTTFCPDLSRLRTFSGSILFSRSRFVRLSTSSARALLSLRCVLMRATSSAVAKGLEMKSVPPDSRPSITWSRSAWPLTIRMGTSVSSLMLRMIPHSSRPLISGRRMSNRITSGL